MIIAALLLIASQDASASYGAAAVRQCPNFYSFDATTKVCIRTKERNDVKEEKFCRDGYKWSNPLRKCEKK